ncbi:MAG: hypothetical protein HY650_10105 [Acidobacteria bacterium]|nr:hypothetical protein [Acidobacteriota bacterium]
MKNRLTGERKDPQRFRLNPCDYLLLSVRRAWEAQGMSGGCTMMVLDTEGELPPERVYQALARAMDAHPITKARIRYNRWSGRPVWEMPNDSEDSARGAFTFLDLRDAPDWSAEMLTLSQERCAIPPDMNQGPQVRLDYYAGPRGRARICLRWSHELMDGEGARWFFAEMTGPGEDGRNESVVAPRPDGEIIDVLAQKPLSERLRLAWRAVRAVGAYGKLTYKSLTPAPAVIGHGLRLRFKVFEAEDFATIQANALAVCPNGPALLARYLAACVIRSLHRLYTARSIELPIYSIALPMSVRPGGARPVPGNYLVWMPLLGHRERVMDTKELGVDLHAQMTYFLEREMAEGNWVVIQALSKLSVSRYQKMIQLGLQKHRGLAGFSYIGSAGPTISSFLGARVTNIWATTPVPAPPGWNAVFYKLDKQLTFSLNWIRDFIPDELAEEFMTIIEEEAVYGPRRVR